MASRTLELQYLFNAPREHVFAAWTQPDIIRQWWCTPGFSPDTIEVDLRPKGAYRYALLPEGAGPSCTMEGHFQEVSAPEKLVYSWTIRAGEYVVTDTTVTVNFADDGGNTRLSLVHSGFQQDVDYELHAKDWPIVLEQLAALSVAV